MKQKGKLWKKNVVSVEEKVRCGDGLLTGEGLEVLGKRVTASATAEVKWRVS